MALASEGQQRLAEEGHNAVAERPAARVDETLRQSLAAPIRRRRGGRRGRLVAHAPGALDPDFRAPAAVVGFGRDVVAPF